MNLGDFDRLCGDRSLRRALVLHVGSGLERLQASGEPSRRLSVADSGLEAITQVTSGRNGITRYARRRPRTSWGRYLGRSLLSLRSWR